METLIFVVIGLVYFGLVYMLIMLYRVLGNKDIELIRQMSESSPGLLKSVRIMLIVFFVFFAISGIYTLHLAGEEFNSY